MARLEMPSWWRPPPPWRRHQEALGHNPRHRDLWSGSQTMPKWSTAGGLWPSRTETEVACPPPMLSWKCTKPSRRHIQPASPSSMCRTTTTSLSCETDQSDVQLALTHVDDHHFGSVANPLFTIYWCHWYKTLAEKEPQLFSHYGSFDQPALQSLNDCKFCCFGLPTKI